MAVNDPGDALPPLGPPSLARMMVEGPRAAWGIAALPFRWRAMLADMPHGQGRPVLLLPGLFNTDRSNFVLARYLRTLGYAAEGWGMGRNLGVRSIGTDAGRLFARIERMADESGQPVALVGVSLGGIMARLAAHRMPGRVAQVVTVASPYAGHGRDTRVWRLFELATGERIDSAATRAFAQEARRPLPVPGTAIWSASDGLVNGLACRVTDEPGLVCVEVASSHYGVQTRPQVLVAVAKALARNA